PVQHDDELPVDGAVRRVGERAAVGQGEHRLLLGGLGGGGCVGGHGRPLNFCDTVSQRRPAWQTCDTVSTSSQSTRVSAADARARILAAARRLLLERPFAELTVEQVMTEAGLARTVFYRHYADLPQLAPELLPDTDDPIIDHIERVEAEQPEAVVETMIAALVDVYAEHGPLLRAIDDAA